MSALAIDHIAKSYGAAPVLSDLSLDIEQGEFVVLLGPSGCGKSTLLNIVAGLDRADRGRILIGGKDVTRAEPRARDIAMVFQSYALYPTMTARKNMAFGLKMRGVARAEIDRLVDEAARLLRIEDLLDRRPAQLSGGQRQRVAIGRAIVRKPAVFLFDEPLSNLDAKLRAETRLELKELHRRLGATILYVTHDQTEAMTLATRIAVMNRGVIEQVGPPQEVYDRPSTAFVAGFTGAPAMNLVPGVCRGGMFRPDGSDSDLAVPGAPSREKRVLLGLRPEHFHRAGDDETGITLEPLLVEPTGADTNVVFKLGETRIVARFAPGPVGPGPIQVTLDLARASWFDAGTGKRL